MSTRALYGFKVGGKYKLQYNHCDGYPDSLGADVLRAVRKVDAQVMINAANSLVVVSRGRLPTEAQKQVCRDLGIVNLGVGDQSEDDWYCLTRGAQGSAVMLLNGRLPFISDSFDVEPSAMEDTDIEYAYVVNVDDGMVDFYSTESYSKVVFRLSIPIASIKAEPKFDVRGWVRKLTRSEVAA